MAVADLARQVDNFSSWSAGPSLDGLRNVYLTWVREAEEFARRLLLDVPADEFATSRWNSILKNDVPQERMWSVIEGDAKAHLDWFGAAVSDLGTHPDEDVDDPADDLWRPGHIRVFVSHLASKKAFASQVSQELAKLGIHGFVAHDAIEPSREWQAEIERALRTAHAFVGLLHAGFKSASWTQQEVGWAVGRPMPVFTVRLEEDPTGFVARFQAPRLPGDNAWQVASSTAVWLTTIPALAPTVIERLMADVRSAGSLKDAERAALRIEQLDRMSPALLDELEAAYRTNDQLYPHHLGATVVERILNAHGRTLPA